MNYTHLYKSAQSALFTSLTVIVLAVFSFFALEPAIGRAITDEFLVTQSITSEISFLTTAANVSLSPAIAGVTGGVSSGTTTVVVLTNDSAGYNMTLGFASTTQNPGVAMNGNTQGGYIANYTNASAGVPDYGFSVAANTAEFAYTVGASTTADLDTTFRNNASACNNNSGGDVAFSCWMSPSTTPLSSGEMIVNRTSETAASGATTSIAFRLQVSANPSPAVPEDTYVATATLTALTN